MTLLAGIYSRHSGTLIPDALCGAIQNALSRHPGEHMQHFRDERCFLVKADIGAYGERAFRIDRDAVSLLVGEPLLAHGDGTRRSRASDLDELHDALSKNQWESLSRARGVFSAVHYRPGTGALTLATDKLGIRPVYYWVGERFVVFATALRILEQVSQVPKVMNVRAVTEMNSFGFPLGDRTPFESVRLLKSAEVLRVEGDKSSSLRYWRWDKIESSDRPVAELVEDAHRKFTDAIALRCDSDSTTVAFLSGGLDSRAIVTALSDRGLLVHTFNFSVTGLQDQVFSALYAHRLGTIHTERPMKPTQTVTAMVMAEAWNSSPERHVHPAERPSLVWSGDGGSVTLGHVYLNRPMVAAARADGAQAAMELGTSGWGSAVPRRLLTGMVAAELSSAPRKGLLDEFAELHCTDPGRALHLLLMHNDQRRHLAQHFEDIDLSRLEYQLPFFDSDFVESVLRVPVDISLGHGLYMKWLQHFPEVTLSVPWQAYPGHEPCPLPVPSGVVYQWGNTVGRIVNAAERRDLLHQAGLMLRASDFPKPLLRREYLRFATWLYRLRLRDVRYVIRSARLYCEYWSKCGGQYVPPTPMPIAVARERESP